MLAADKQIKQVTERKMTRHIAFKTNFKLG
jgi:hypothetical protein